MYGDMMYCNNCGKPFMDVWRGRDTRTNKKILSNCPHCKSCSSLNASQFMKNYEKRAPNQHSNTILYKHIKELHIEWLKTWIATKPSSVFLTEKESANFDVNYAFRKTILIVCNAGVTFDELAAALSMLSSPKVYI